MKAITFVGPQEVEMRQVPKPEIPCRYLRQRPDNLFRTSSQSQSSAHHGS